MPRAGPANRAGRDPRPRGRRGWDPVAEDLLARVELWRRRYVAESDRAMRLQERVFELEAEVEAVRERASPAAPTDQGAGVGAPRAIELDTPWIGPFQIRAALG